MKRLILTLARGSWLTAPDKVTSVDCLMFFHSFLGEELKNRLKLKGVHQNLTTHWWTCSEYHFYKIISNIKGANLDDGLCPLLEDRVLSLHLVRLVDGTDGVRAALWQEPVHVLPKPTEVWVQGGTQRQHRVPAGHRMDTRSSKKSTLQASSGG